MRDIRKIIAATHIIEGPVGVSKKYAIQRPLMAEAEPIKAAIKTITSGVLAKLRAAAGGIRSIAAISSTPTTFIATDTVIAKEIVKKSCSFLGFIPLAYANSSLKVVVKSEDQRQYIKNNTIPTPIQITNKSKLETAKISPTRYAIRSFSPSIIINICWIFCPDYIF